jgi:hypothetical protein
VVQNTGSCRETLRKFLAWLALEEDRTASPNTAGYCKARKRLRVEAIQNVHRCLVQRIETAGGVENIWCGRRVKVIDGSSVSMPDTVENQARYPQPKAQKAGCGFPVMRIVGVFSLGTGVLLTLAKDSLSVAERTLFRRLWDVFEPGDVALADTGFTSYADFHYLNLHGVDPVMRNHQRRKKGLTELQRLGKNDRIIAWHKNTICPRNLSNEQWNAIPDRLTVREITVHVNIPGFRTDTIVIVTTLLDPKAFPPRAFAELYRMRWAVELYLRDIKTALGMDILRCKTPNMVDKELWMHLIAYNLIRALMREAATAHARRLERISFTGTLVTIRQWAPTIAHAHAERRAALHDHMLHYLADDLVPHRPNRTEPRARKRRPKNYQLLTKPRRLFKEIPHRNRYRKDKS